jgi:SHS2 domain-containing protein
MPYEFLEDSVTSDVTFRAWGARLADAFVAAAEATTNVMVGSLEAIRPRVRVPVAVRAESLDLLLFRFLGEIVFRKDAAGLLLRPEHLRIEERDGQYGLTGELCGEALDPARHELLADVKAVTLHGLRVSRVAAGWEVQVTLDV